MNPVVDLRTTLKLRVSLSLPAACSVRPLSAAVALAAMAFVPVTHAEDLFGDALAKGKTNLELRLRHESVDQTGVLNTANASTLRTRVRYTSGEWRQSSLMLEIDNVSRVGDERYNDLRNSKGGATGFPTVVDPNGSDLNQALIKYMGVANTPITVGRQRMNLDNQRFIGSVAWRQNEQTLDGITMEFKGIDRFTATYGFITRVNRINGPESGAAPALAELDSESHLVNLKYAASGALTAVAYAYLLDFDPNSISAASSETMGLRLTGSVPVGEFKFGYAADVAQQSDYGNNKSATGTIPGTGFTADYMLAELSFGKTPWEVQFGYELLGSDNGISVQTPLATLHKFQGWADKFLTTPGVGLLDTYVGVTTKVADIGMTLAAHQYEGDSNDADYGDEINVQFSKTFAKRYTLTLKFADYSTGTVAAVTDTTKVWLMAEAKF